jgi:hypothetical protein
MPKPQPIPHPVPQATVTKHYYGKYRGTVVENVDPLQLGRIIATVPDVAGVVPLSWAMPCTPFPIAGSPPLTVPSIGSSVWIEFEAGNPDYPIWSGGFWTEGQAPLLLLPST